jgi:hypothetical protein
MSVIAPATFKPRERSLESGISWALYLYQPLALPLASGVLARPPSQYVNTNASYCPWFVLLKYKRP